ncbi:MAG: transposase family protein [Aureispira sp.]|nr:transposase family protein [Aureispira sp.]
MHTQDRLICSYIQSMNYDNLKQNPTNFLSLTSLKIEEFEKLLSVFYGVWVRYFRWHTLEGKKRKFPNARPEQDTKTLATVEDKLLFALVYLKNYPLQQFQAASFGLSQAKVSIWMKLLQPSLLESLKQLGVVPLREGHKLAQLLEEFGDDSYSQDVTERSIHRNSDQDVQGNQYSNKKKDIR